MKKGKDKAQENLPPSLFDNLDLFAAGGGDAAPKAAEVLKAIFGEKQTSENEGRER